MSEQTINITRRRVTDARPKQRYRRITPDIVSRFQAERAIQGSGTRAIEVLEPGYKHPGDRAAAISKKIGSMSPDEYVEQAVEQVAVTAIDRVEDIVNSTDEAVALRASQFVIEQRRGKAVQKSESKAVILNIEAVLG